MNIIACSYTNLWPFADRTVSLVVHPWAAMIIAPVGTGKSMLFFDWVVYWLYKYSTRDVINNASSTAAVSMLIEIGWEYRLITRQLKATKARSISTTSSLARRTGDISQIYMSYPEIIYADRNIIAELDPNSSEIVIFKNESDLQRTLEELLPARDVFLNRDMMMQESSNLFDLTQTQRIDVFKHLFGLMDIDAAKDKLWEEKMRLKYLLQAKQDTSIITTKFDQAIVTLKSTWSALNTNELVNLNDYDGVTIQHWIDESSILGTTISIDKVPLIARDQQAPIRASLEHHTTRYHQLQAQITHLTQQVKDQQILVGQSSTKQSQLIQQILQHESTLASHKPEELQWYKSDKLLLIQQINDLEFGINYDVFGDDIADLTQAYEYLNGLVQQGKELQLKLDNNTNQIASGEERLKLQATHAQSTRKNLEDQIAWLHTQITSKQEKLEISSKFYCVKIEADCPFVDQIAQGVITSHARELDLLQANHTSLILSLAEIDKPVTSLNDLPSQIQELQVTKSDLENQIKSLRSRLVKLWYKQIAASYPQFQTLNTQLKLIDQKIAAYDAVWQQIEQATLSLHTAREDLTRVQSEHTQIIQLVQEYQTQLETIQQEWSQAQANYHTITTYESQLQRLVEIIARINELIHDYKTSQWEILRIQSRAKQVDELYTIVSKELTVMVLQEYLPILSDTINNLLSKVVEYRLGFSINPAWDKLEIMIVDQFGSREVKTLSGGQRAILRLCWILSIALWSGNQFLFLDETINHLDREMISKAAELIEDFVKGNRISLYAITHSEQIQAINIWDYVVNLQESLGDKIT